MRKYTGDSIKYVLTQKKPHKNSNYVLSGPILTFNIQPFLKFQMLNY